MIGAAFSLYKQLGRFTFLIILLSVGLARVEGTEGPLLDQAIVLALVAIFNTAGLHGVVGFIVKMDDIRIRIARGAFPIARLNGSGLVRAISILMRALSIIGTAAMLWVGNGILVHGLEFCLTGLPHLIHHLADQARVAMPAVGLAALWIVNAFGAGIVGLMVGAIITALF